MSDLRDAIVRVLYEHHVEGMTDPHTWEAIVEGGKNRPYPEYPHLVDEFRARADAVLAILAELPESVIERAAAQIYYWDVNPTTQDWESRPSGGQEDYREGARAAFRAAFGGESND